MKTTYLLIVIFVLALISTGCFSGPHQQGFTQRNYSRFENPNRLVDQLTLPDNKFRNHSFSYSGFTMDGGMVYYNESQGGNTYVYRSWDRYGPRQEVQHSDYKNKTYSYTPQQ